MRTKTSPFPLPKRGPVWRITQANTLRCLWPHTIPFILVFGIGALAGRFNDPDLVRFARMFTWRYYRFFVLLYGFRRYKPSLIPEKPTYSSKDVTLVLPTVSVSPSENPHFEECLTTWLVNKPAHIIVVTDTRDKAMLAKRRYRKICSKIKSGSSPFLGGLGAGDVSCVKASFRYAGNADKRAQMALAIPLVETQLTVFFDDHVFVKPLFLRSVMAVFEDPHVGLCGTRKSVRREIFHTGSFLRDFWLSVWNFLARAYLARHNFETQGTNAIDHGTFVISGRGFMIRTELIKNKEFLESFRNERIFGLPWAGRVSIGDDNFITAWVLHRGYEIKVQHTEDATAETALGEPETFIWKCLRWRRTTYLSNLSLLMTSRTVWLRWRWTVWLAHIPALFNLALVWDCWMITTFVRTGLYSGWAVFGLGTWIYFTKVVKLLPLFQKHPRDFFMFFFPIPVYPYFAYFHSFISIVTMFTCCNQNWEGRRFDSKPQSTSQHSPGGSAGYRRSASKGRVVINK